MSNYSSTLCNRFGGGWTRFWFTPSDPIVLSLIRVLTGLAALWWYLSYLPELQAWFGPHGVFPSNLTQRVRQEGGNFAFSLLDFVETASQLWFVFGLGAAALLLMTVGVFTRISTIVALVFVLSFIHRAPMLARPVDDILALVMFYLCIGPAGANFSLDAWWRNRRAAKPAGQSTPNVRLSSAATVATRLMQIHLALVYAAMAVAQLQGEAWWQGTAVWWLMARPESRLVDLTFLRGLGQGFIYLVNFCTHFIVLYEVCFALLIWNSLARPILLVLGVFVWTGIAVVGGSVSFAVLMLVANLVFLPPETLRDWCEGCCAGQTEAPSNKTVAVPR